MENALKALARRSKTAIILFKIFDNWRFKRRSRSNSIESIHGSTHSYISIPEGLAYIERQFANYLTYASLSERDLVGKKILELGPGDNLGVALKFVAAGADTIVCLDRFYSKRDQQREKELYTALRDQLDDDQRQRFDDALALDRGIEFNCNKVATIYGQTIEEYAAKNSCRFDLIVSCAVLEEIYDPSPTFKAMDLLLARGGRLIHQIDLSDYGMFRKQGMHPLTFLTLSESLYSLMASDSGLPNRKRLSYYVSKMKDLGYDGKFFATSVIPEGRNEPAINLASSDVLTDSGRDLLRSIRGKLDVSFKSMDENDLLVDGLLLVARKPL